MLLMMAKTKPQWLLKFEHKLRTNKLRLAPSQPILLQDNDYKYASKFYQDEELITDSDHVTYHFIDLLKHVNRAGSTLEKVILSHYSICSIIFQSKILDNILASNLLAWKLTYHVVLLDATADFTQNYFLKLVEPLDTSMNDYTYDDKAGYKTDLDYLPYSARVASTIALDQAQCMVFVNDDGDYFLALPCLFNNKPSELPTCYLEKATIKQIRQILKPMPLVRAGNFYPLTSKGLYYYGSHDDDLYFMTYDNLHTSTTYMMLLANKYQKDPSGFADYFYQSLTVKDAPFYGSYLTITNDLERIYETNITNYLIKNLAVEINSVGEPIFTLKHATPLWQKILQRLTKITFDRSSFETIFNMYWVAICPDIYNICIQKVAAKMSFALQQIQNKPISHDLSKQQRTVLKPLSTESGLNKIWLTLREGDNQKYYLDKQHLVTLVGSSRIDTIKGGDLDD